MNKITTTLRRVKPPSFDAVWRLAVLVLLAWIGWSLHDIATNGISAYTNNFELSRIVDALNDIKQAIIMR